MITVIPECCCNCRYAVDKILLLPGVNKDNPACSKDDNLRSVMTHYKARSKPVWCPMEPRNRNI